MKKLYLIILAAMMAVMGFAVTAYAEDKDIPSVDIYVSEDYEQSGTADSVKVSAGYSIRYEMEGYEFSTPYDQWRSGTPVEIAVTFKAKDGYRFTDSTSFRSYSMDIRGSSGDEKTRTVRYSYVPKKTMSAPANVYHSSQTVVRWDKVEGAKRYMVKVYEDGELVKTMYTTSGSVDLSQFGTDGQEVTCTVSALSSTRNDDSIIKSFDVTPEDGIYHGDNTVNGKFNTSGTKKYFRLDEGGKAYGWQYISGNWYHFDENTGYADGPGWYRDTDGSWYYFRSDCRMATGHITDNGYEYYLSTDDNGPYGAMVTGWHDVGPGNKGEFFNDGTYADVPIGAKVSR